MFIERFRIASAIGQGATKREGSWWPEWTKWVARRGGAKVPARAPGAGALKVLEPAPGSYVKVKTEG